MTKKMLVLLVVMALLMVAPAVVSAMGGAPGMNSNNNDTESTQSSGDLLRDRDRVQDPDNPDCTGPGSDGTLTSDVTADTPQSQQSGDQLRQRDRDTVQDPDNPDCTGPNAGTPQGQQGSDTPGLQDRVRDPENCGCTGPDCDEDCNYWQFMNGQQGQSGDQADPFRYRLRVFYNDSELAMDVCPFIKQGRVMVPVRCIAEKFGAAVQYQAEQRIVNINADTQIQLRLNHKMALVNGKEVELDVPPELNSSRTFVPLRFICEAFNAAINYDPATGLVTVSR